MSPMYAAFSCQAVNHYPGAGPAQSWLWKKSLLAGIKEQPSWKEQAANKHCGSRQTSALVNLLTAVSLSATPSPLSPALQPPGAAAFFPPGVFPSPGSSMLSGLAGWLHCQAHYPVGQQAHSLTQGSQGTPGTWLSPFPATAFIIFPSPAQPCCTDNCPLLLSTCLNPTKSLSKCPES